MMSIAAIARTDRPIAGVRTRSDAGGAFAATLAAAGPSVSLPRDRMQALAADPAKAPRVAMVAVGAPSAQAAPTAVAVATDAVAAFDLDYSNVEHSQADFEAYYAEGARNVSAAQGLPEGRYDFSAMSARELRIVTGHLVGSGAVRFGDIAHLTIRLGRPDGTMPGEAPTDWFAVANDQIADATARHETGVIPYLQSAIAALQGFQTKSDRPAGARSIGAAAPAQAGARLTAALEAFRKEGAMTPAQRVRRDVLKDMKLTEDALKAMPPEERDAIEKTIGQEVARRLKAMGIDGDGNGGGTRSVAELIAAS